MPPRRSSYGDKIFSVAGPSRGSMSPNIKLNANPSHPVPPPSKKKRAGSWSKRSKNGFNNSSNQDSNGSNNGNSGLGNGNNGSGNGNSGSSNGKSGSNNGSSGSNNASGGSNNGNNGSDNASDASAPTPTASGFPFSKPPSNFCPQCLVPDNSPNVHYNGTWILNGPQSSTTHSTTVSGSTISLRFNGSSIFVIGIVPASNDILKPPTAVYFIDQDPPFSTTLPRASTAIPNQPLFASSRHLSDDEHLLVINITDASAPYSLQKFFIAPGGSSSKDMIGEPPTGVGISTSMIIPTPTSTDATSSDPQVASPQSPEPPSAHHKDKTVKTLAGVLGTIAFLMLAAVTVFFIFRRRIIAKRQLALSAKSRPDTLYTSFTSTESILRNDSGFWSSPLRSPRSQYTRSEVRSFGPPASDVGRRSTIDFAPPPLPPKPAIFSSFPKPG